MVQQQSGTTKAERLIQTIQQLPPSEKEQVVEAVLQFLQTETAIRSLCDIKAQYPDEWLAVIVPEGEDRYAPQRGRLVAHSPDRSFVWRQVCNLPASADVFVFFNGQVATKGFEVVFHDTTDTPDVAKVGD
jgi:hypothetical protein